MTPLQHTNTTCKEVEMAIPIIVNIISQPNLCCEKLVTCQYCLFNTDPRSLDFNHHNSLPQTL